MSSKIPLDVGWRMGLPAQVPVKEETTTTFDSSTVTHEFGLDNAALQTMVLAPEQMADHARGWRADFAAGVGG